MTKFEKTNSDKNIEIVKQVYLGINQNDQDSVLNLFDSNVYRVEFEGHPAAGTYSGHAELRTHLISGRSTWAEGACEPLEFFCNLNKIVVVVHIKVRLKNEVNWIDAISTDGFALKDGLVTEFHSFTDKQKAFSWAKISN